RRTLASAAIEDVPVYPNTEIVAPELARYYRELVSAGFSVNIEGEVRRYKVAEALASDVSGVDDLLKLDLTGTHSAAELILIRQVVIDELNKRDEAGRVLASLRLAISELTAELATSSTNEHRLQRTLTANPILFGVEYFRILPK